MRNDWNRWKNIVEQERIKYINSQNPQIPVGPNNPVNPIDLVNPTDPTLPVDPFDPVGPTVPINPFDPILPDNPEIPINPDVPQDMPWGIARTMWHRGHGVVNDYTAQIWYKNDVAEERDKVWSIKFNDQISYHDPSAVTVWMYDESGLPLG